MTFLYLGDGAGYRDEGALDGLHFANGIGADSFHRRRFRIKLH
jgi:hypothetical protein